MTRTLPAWFAALFFTMCCCADAITVNVSKPKDLGWSVDKVQGRKYKKWKVVFSLKSKEVHDFSYSVVNHADLIKGGNRIDRGGDKIGGNSQMVEREFRTWGEPPSVYADVKDQKKKAAEASKPDETRTKERDDLSGDRLPTWVNPRGKTEAEKRRDGEPYKMPKPKQLVPTVSNTSPRTVAGTYRSGPTGDRWNKNSTSTIVLRADGTGKMTNHTEFVRPYGGADHWDFEFDLTYTVAGEGRLNVAFGSPRTLSGSGSFGFLARPSLRKAVFTVSGGSLMSTRKLDKEFNPYRKGGSGGSMIMAR